MRLTKDLLSGVMFLAFGIAAALVAHSYSVGTISHMGTGFFPFVISGLITAMGLIIFVRALLRPDNSEVVATIAWRPVLFISAAIVAFGLVIERLGVLAALAALIIVGRFAGREGSVFEVGLMVVVLCAVVVGIFVYGLNIRLHLGPW